MGQRRLTTKRRPSASTWKEGFDFRFCQGVGDRPNPEIQLSKLSAESKTEKWWKLSR